MVETTDTTKEELRDLQQSAIKLFNQGEIQNSITIFKTGLEKGKKLFNNEFAYDLGKFYYGFGTAILARLEQKQDTFGEQLAKEQQEERVKGVESEENKGNNEEQIKEIQLAWENLEVSRVIAEKRWNEIKDSETFPKEELNACQNRIAKVKLRLGDLEVYRNRFEEALQEYEACLQIRLELEEKSCSRNLAEIYFLIGNVYAYKNTEEAWDKALKNYTESRVILEVILKKELGLTVGKFFGNRNIFNVEQKLNRQLLVENEKDSETSKEIKKILVYIYDKIESGLKKKEQCQEYRILDLDWLLDDKSYTFQKNPLDFTANSENSGQEQKKIKRK